MRKDFRVFTLEEYEAFCDFVTGLSKQGKKFTVTPHLKTRTVNGGFVVWFYC